MPRSFLRSLSMIFLLKQYVKGSQRICFIAYNVLRMVISIWNPERTKKVNEVYWSIHSKKVSVETKQEIRKEEKCVSYEFNKVDLQKISLVHHCWK